MLIAIHGLKRAGKGTIANHLIRYHGFELIKFATPLKNMLKYYLQRCGFSDDIIERCLEGDLKEALFYELGNKSPRFLMQILGTEWRNQLHTNMWGEIASLFISQKLSLGKKLVLDDYRFSHETLIIKRFPSVSWIVTNNRFYEDDLYSNYQSEKKVFIPMDDDIINGMIFTLVNSIGIDMETKGDIILPGITIEKMKETLKNTFFNEMKKDLIIDTNVTAKHSSENGLPINIFDKHIENNGSKEELYSKIDNLIK